MLGKQGLTSLFITVGSLCIATQAQASACTAYVGVGDDFYEGNTVCFVWNTADIDPLYGGLMGSGDNIFVTPNNFRAEATGAGASDTKSGEGFIQIVAKPGYFLDGVSIGETGDYQMQGTSGSVSISAEMSVEDWNNASGPSDTQTLTVTGPLNIQDGLTHNWSANGSIDLSTSIWDGIDHIKLSLLNVLTADSDASGDFAWIQKKAVGSQIVVTTIPVPAAAWLLVSGLLGLAGFARRGKI